MADQFSIAVIPGDGIGKEVIPEGLKVLQAAAKQQGVQLNFTHFDWSCERYHKTGRMMPENGIDKLRNFDAIFLGAVGFPGVPDHISLWELLLTIRRAFNQYVNLRPVRLFEGIQSPLANKKPGDIDFYVVRENVEGEYSSIGGIQYEGTEDEVVSQQSIFTRKGTDRILKYAFDLAQSREKKHLSSATKSNGLFHSMPYWDSRVAAMAKNYPEVRVDQFHIDIFAANLVRMPEFYDVIVGSNLFGDILSDLGPACTGTIAIAPSANINPEKDFPSMFEPVHGSAPDIAGLNIANPIGTIWAAAMMMQHLGCPQIHDIIMNAIETVIRERRSLTRDMGGKGSTQELGQAITDIIILQ
ncbi:tartrate dehydrogenase [Moellerella wisconsensis]|uniref:tartrate dehydrogenase n=1 Tax=Moellerella wisconsensis TaxID=158849 RepID=UPI0006412383|nr:tartrate dehydrogenase [Moellerella wisconsensis]KLN97010.1 tartrate dehydrogenase [Moellerella wisconsensis]UNH23802.1 tartrate dehydrogenase [Moellerella wisconsensis]UNH42048.1 tartrate dehydrogenase [Moellerella wisconsensis]WJW81517.1 tartrate dehydrogenase [Moellerella wisconsensis]